MNEQEMAREVIKWLAADGWEIYQEVSTGPLSPVADIVGIKNGLSWIIETKTRYGLQVLDQVCKWLSWQSANFISVAVMSTKKQKGIASYYFHHDKGIGLIEVDGTGWINSVTPPKLIRTRGMVNIKNIVCEQHKTFAEAGAANGGYYTPFKETVRKVRRYVEENPGTTIKEMIDYTGHLHYSNPQSAKGAIAKYIRTGVIGGIIMKRKGKKHCLYYESK